MTFLSLWVDGSFVRNVFELLSTLESPSRSHFIMWSGIVQNSDRRFSKKIFNAIRNHFSFFKNHVHNVEELAEISD